MAMTWRVPTAITFSAVGIIALVAIFAMDGSRDMNAQLEPQTAESEPKAESISVVFPDYTFVTESGIDGLRISPDSSQEVYLGDSFAITIEDLDGTTNLEEENTTVELIPLNGAPELVECRGPLAVRTEGGAEEVYAISCEPQAVGKYLLRIQSSSASGAQPSSVYRQVHSEIISVLEQRRSTGVVQPSPPASLSVVFEFLEGSGDSWWHPPLYSFESGALVRRVCDPGDDYYGYGKTGSARPIEADGVVGPILAYGTFEGECTVPPEQGLGGVNTGLAGRSWAIRIPASEIEKRLPPSGCLKIRFDSGAAGNSFNVVCLKKG